MIMAYTEELRLDEFKSFLASILDQGITDF